MVHKKAQLKLIVPMNESAKRKRKKKGASAVPAVEINAETTKSDSL